MTLIVALPIGLLIGVSLGALGGGGSILTVPALVYLLGQDAREATTGSLIIVGVTSLAGLLVHFRAGNVRVQRGLVFGLLGIGGAYLGSRASVHIPQPVLLTAFSLLLLVVAAVMISKSRTRRAAPNAQGDAAVFDEPLVRFRPEFHCACQRVLIVLVAATVVGLLTGFFGVGGGFAIVPALALVLRFPMPVAVGTSLLVIVINSVSALTIRLDQGVSMDWSVIGAFTAAAVIGSLAGGHLASRIQPHRLSLGFAVLIVLVALYTAARSIPTLL